MFSLVAVLALIFIFAAGHANAQVSVVATTGGDFFYPLDQWKNAVIGGDAATVRNFYSADPVPEIDTKNGREGASEDIAFWLGLKPKSIKLEIVRLRYRPSGINVIFKSEIQTDKGLYNVTDAVSWQQQGDRWRIVGAERTDAPQLQQPADMKKDLYPANADARAEIKEAEAKAATQHKRVLLVFGADWCFDCHVLDIAFRRPDFASAISSYEVVHVDIGDDGKKNNDLAKELDTPLDKGVPVLAVLDANGKVVFSQKNGEFEDARSLAPEALLAFLNKWKPEAR
ncbi:MAG TPA: thioredoxin family protein [Candidatus Binatia bacterium]|nr:thioredoxin family protein [Candidatus Binatia bacterium]